MRALLVSLAFVAAAWTGCLAAETETDGGLNAASTLDVASIKVPSGATLVEEGGNAILRFADVALPFRETFQVPAGATIVRTMATVGDTVPISTYMFNEETGRRRCNPDSVDSWGLGIRGAHQCSSVAAIDPPGATWVATASSALAGAVADIDIVFETTPLDGLAAQLDLSQLSMPTHELLPTEYLMVDSFDGTPLWVEITVPEGEGPWPTIIGSSPYNGVTGRGQTPAMWEYFTHDWAKRGYAIVNVDVRGYGMSGGCVEVWSENEQKDQSFIVDWVAQQAWSDGNVGFYGQSYVATTPVAAAVQAPDALKAIIAVAPVMDAYFDWHYGGVPNGESFLSPVAYQILTDSPPVPAEDMPTDPALLAAYATSSFCDPTLMARANDPRMVYDAFYVERNFSARAADITAAVLYTQGFEDSNVKSAMIPDWFNNIEAPKLGVFGHWVHQHPTRTDEEIMFLGWMDQYVKGKPVGFENVAPVHVVVDDELSRTGTTWPPVEAQTLALPADLGAFEFAPNASGPDAQLVLSPAGGGSNFGAPPANAHGIIILDYEVPVDTAVAGVPRVAITGTLVGAANGFIFAEMYDVGPDGTKLMSYGAINLALRNGYDAYDPVVPGAEHYAELPFLPTEHIFREGHTLRVVLFGAGTEAFIPTQPGVYTLGSGEKTQLLLPTLPMDAYVPTPATALR